jgi:hypothetical protein
LARVPEALAYCGKLPLDDMPDDAVNWQIGRRNDCCAQFLKVVFF